MPPHGSALVVFDPAEHHLPDHTIAPDLGASDRVLPVTGSWTLVATGRVADGSKARFAGSLPNLFD